MTGVNLDQLRAMSAQLNAASDGLSAQIAQLETILNGLKLGVRAWVTISRHSEESNAGYMTYVEMLGYSKHNGKWGLLYSDGCEEMPDRDTVVPLREAPRLERIAAVDKIPELIKKLEAAAADVAAEASSKASQLADLVADLTRPAK